MINECLGCGASLKGNVCEFCGRVQNVELTNINSQTQQVIDQVVINNPLVQQYSTITSESKKNKVSALILCVVFGYLGFHRFYVGQLGMGIVYLFTVGLFGIGWIADIVLIVTVPYSILKDEYDTAFMYDINGLKLEVTSHASSMFREKIPDWYMKTIDLIIKKPNANYNIGDYIFFKKRC